MTESIRLFVAAQLPVELMEQLVKERQVFNVEGISLVPEENLHLKLYFIGNVPASEVCKIFQQLTEVARQHEPFMLTLEQLEPGPKPRSPRLIWARFRQHAAYEKLSRELTQIISPVAPRQEKFIPHVTLCRFSKDGLVPGKLPLVTPEHEINYQVNALALWQSQLSSPHPMYTVLEVFSLLS